MTLRVASQQFVSEAQVRASDCACIGANSPDSDVIDRLIDQASDMIAIVTGQTIAGRQNVIARPCRTSDYACMPCPCCVYDSIPLGDADTAPTITAVWENGAQLDASLYRLHWNRVAWMLARLPDAGETTGWWPSSQRRFEPYSEEGTLAILFSQGIHVDSYIIEAAALEIICDLAQDELTRANTIEGATAVSAGGSNVVLDRNLVRTSDETRLKRIANGELGPMCRRMMGICAPNGRSSSMVWAPELTFGWELNLEIDTTP